MVPASFDFCLANLNREASSAGTPIPSKSLNPTVRFLGSILSSAPDWTAFEPTVQGKPEDHANR